MNKRQKKKVGRRYHLLRQAQKLALKRKGEKCVAYAIVEMGESDMIRFHKHGFGAEYSNATHWLIYVRHRKDIYLKKERAPYQTLVFPCTSQGTSDTNSPVYIVFHCEDKPEDVLLFFEQAVEDMKQDRYWETDY